MQNRECQIKLRTDFENLPVLERFIKNCPLLSADQVPRAMLIATEYFDNIICHGRCLRYCPVSVKITADSVIRLQFQYRSSNFNEMIAGHQHTSPHYDIDSDRYRGLGLRMCHNLSSHIEYKKGLFKNYIIITL